jgi:hypothetical protein
MAQSRLLLVPDELMVDRLYDEAYPSLGEPFASFVNRYLDARVLAQQSIGVFVRAALPWTPRTTLRPNWAT